MKIGSMSWTSVMMIARLARLESGLRLSWSCGMEEGVKQKAEVPVSSIQSTHLSKTGFWNVFKLKMSNCAKLFKLLKGGQVKTDAAPLFTLGRARESACTRRRVSSETPECDGELSHRGVDGQLVGHGGLVVQCPRHGDGPSCPINGEEWRRRLEGEEHAAACALVGVRGIHHEDGGSHWGVLWGGGGGMRSLMLQDRG